MLILKMAFRNIFRQRRRTVLTGLSMMVGFFLAAVFIGWSEGSYNDIIDKFTSTRMGHIQIHQATYLERPSIYKTIDDVNKVAAVIEEAPNIRSWAPRIYSGGLASVGEKSAGVRIIGIDPKKEEQTTKFSNQIIQGRSLSQEASHEVVLGKELANILETRVDEEIVIISQAADGSIANDLYTIVGISSSGNKINDRVCFTLHLADAQELLVLEGRVHEIALTVDKLGRVGKVNAILNEGVDDPELSVVPWQVFAKSFYDAMQIDKEGMWIMLLIIVIIVTVGVLNTVLMSVLERRREYGLLKAVGTKPGQIIRLVLTEVAILAVISIVIGTGPGLAVNSYLASHGMKISSFYKGLENFTYGGMTFDVIKSEVNLMSFTIPAVTVFLSAIFVSLIPALKAARTEPAKTMRMH